MLDLFGYDVIELPKPEEQLSLPLVFRSRITPAPSFYLEVWNDTEIITMAQETETMLVGMRWANALRRQYREKRNYRKDIARDFDVDVRTVDSWLRGGSPQAKSLCKAWRLFGPLFVADVLAPDAESRILDADAALREIETKINLIGEKLVFLRKAGPK